MRDSYRRPAWEHRVHHFGGIAVIGPRAAAHLEAAPLHPHEFHASKRIFPRRPTLLAQAAGECLVQAGKSTGRNCDDGVDRCETVLAQLNSVLAGHQRADRAPGGWSPPVGPREGRWPPFRRQFWQATAKSRNGDTQYAHHCKPGQPLPDSCSLVAHQALPRLFIP